ncbi:hypothetical protein [Phyllobacterium sp. OV277]|uniref:hypothetical protein n=1 Tax=Phyllobacterium sp. OV277 TaxID=1882772 RepID=UPI000880D4CE|nr:hypothetical protein [Phyllobacterium sp. OV277]SDP68680.1 hypothetical protein SAMN05443582_10828 [Phyllobacterium sp. OV277]
MKVRNVSTDIVYLGRPDRANCHIVVVVGSKWVRSVPDTDGPGCISHTGYLSILRNNIDESVDRTKMRVDQQSIVAASC